MELPVSREARARYHIDDSLLSSRGTAVFGTVKASQKAIAWLYERTGRDAVEAAHLAFAEEFPPPAVARGEARAEVFLEGQTGGTPNRAMVQDEILMLWLANANPAYAPFLDLFD